MNRGRFIVSSACATGLAACSSSSAGMTPSPFNPSPLPSFTRLEIVEFSRNARMVASLRRGVAAMMAIADPRDERSWEYWHRTHWMTSGEPPPEFAQVWNQCKHHLIPYFYAWHRAFVYFFERMLRTMSGDPEFALPYWDYYKHPQLPAIFAAPALAGGGANPLYWKDRVGSMMHGLSYRPYAANVTRFPNPAYGTYERLIEIDPHGRVHDLIGGDMGHVPTAALDPIFWVHHCNIDRLWSAWVAAGGGRAMPPAGSAYYQPTFVFNRAGTWSMDVGTAADESALGVRYSDLSLPMPTPDSRLPARPATVPYGTVALTAQPVSVVLPKGERGTSLRLEGIEMTAAGERGGYSIEVYVDLPELAAPLSEEGDYAVGRLGSFALSETRIVMNGMPADPGVLVFPLPRALRSGEPVVVSFVPVLAAEVAKGTLLARVGSITLE